MHHIRKGHFHSLATSQAERAAICNLQNRRIVQNLQIKMSSVDEPKLVNIQHACEH
jgi:hypothetical protein